jgi:hypothetical protein
MTNDGGLTKVGAAGLWEHSKGRGWGDQTPIGNHERARTYKTVG